MPIIGSIAGGSARGFGGLRTFAPSSQPFSMALTSADTLYVASPILDAGTYTASVSPADTIYFTALDESDNIVLNTTVTNGASVVLSSAIKKVAAFSDSVSSVTFGIGTSPVAITTTAAGAGTLETITSGSNYTPNANGYAYIIGVGAGEGGGTGGTNGGYGGQGGEPGKLVGTYAKLDSASARPITIGAAGNGGTGNSMGNAGGNTSFNVGGITLATTTPTNDVYGSGGGGNSWFGSVGNAQPNPYSGIKSGTNGGGGGGAGNTGGGPKAGGGSGIGTGGAGNNQGTTGGNASGYGAGGGGGGGTAAGGAGSPGVIYVVRGLN
jgi:hypothetical protein